MEKDKIKYKKRNIIIIGSILFVLAIVAAVGGRIAYVNENAKKFDNLILPGVMVENIDLSGKSKDEAKALLKAKFGDEVLKKKINISANKKTYTIDYLKLDAKYNIEDTVNEAYLYGKGLGAFAKYDLIKKAKTRKLELKFSYDPKYIKEVIATIEKDVNKTAVNGSINLGPGRKFNITPDIKGTKLLLTASELEKDIIGKIDGKLNLSVDIVAQVEEIKAAITEEKLLTIDTRLSTFSTNFSSSSNQRANNIVLAANSINGTLLMPGDTFSFNDIVGIRTSERGYQEAPVIIGSKIESGVGGGICQVSGTLYNAILRSSIKATERTHHTIPSSYVEKGLDATIDYGTIDYKFVNTLPYPIYIEASATNRNLTFNIYSNSSLTKRTYEIYNDIYETIQPKTTDVLDPTLKEGDKVIEQIAYLGYKVRVYMKIIENGAVISTDLISDDYYKQVNGIIKIGTKKVSE